jgi:hypothetical protein
MRRALDRSVLGYRPLERVENETGVTGRSQRSRNDHMSLTFEDTIHFDPQTDDAVIWADAPDGSRFRVRVTPRFIFRHWNPRGHLRSALEEAIRAHLDELKAEAEARYQAGAHELNFEIARS